MAEIKSSIELALEKTRHLIMSEEEKKEQERRDLENRVKALIRRLKERYIERDEVIKEFESLENMSQKKVFLKAVLDSMDLSEKNDEIISVLEVINERIKERVDKELDLLSRAFREELEKREMIVRERVREKLKGMGLEGDGVIINTECWEEWEEEKKEVQGVFSQRFERWKENVLKDLSI